MADAKGLLLAPGVPNSGGVALVEVPAVAIIGFAAALVAIFSVGGGALYRLGKMAQEVVYTRESVNEEVTHSREMQQKDTEALNQKIDSTRDNLNQKIDSTQEFLLNKIQHSEEMLLNKIQHSEDMLLKRIQHSEEMLLNKIEHSQEMSRAEHEATRAEIRRLINALLSHSHDADGNIRFPIPPPTSAEP